MEGRCCPLAQFGYNRDGKKGKLQIVYGLLCARRLPDRRRGLRGREWRCSSAILARSFKSSLEQRSICIPLLAIWGKKVGLPYLLTWNRSRQKAESSAVKALSA